MTRFLLQALVVVLVGMVLTVGHAVAGTVSVTVKNLTNGLYFTPLLVTAHDENTHLFEPGTQASFALQAMAEGGNISFLSEMVGGADQDTVENPAGGLLAPGGIVSDIALDPGPHHGYLSLVAMLLPTNDGFVGLDSVPIPNATGVYKYYLFGYDAGTEANDELITGGGAPGVPGIPVAPGGDGGDGGFGGTGVSAGDTNTMVHIHRGVVGDTDPEGGISDVDSTIHRWLNPVAEVVIKVN